MFLRFAAKGSAAWLGLLAVALPVSAGSAKVVALKSVRTAPAAVAAPATSVRRAAAAVPTPVSVRSTRVSVTTRTTAPKPKKPATRGPNYLGKRALRVIPVQWPVSGATVPRTTAPSPSAVVTPTPKTHGGTAGIDTNITNGSFNSVEPRYLTSGTALVYTANGRNGKDAYPPPAPDITKDATADPPVGIQEPTFLIGVNDYHLRYQSTAGANPLLLRIAVGTNEGGEQFEPSVSGAGTLGFSAFLGIHHDAYKPDVTFTLPDGTTGSLDYHGFPVRTLCLSDDAISKSQTADNGTISKFLQPDVFGVLPIKITDDQGNVTTKYMPAFTPDCTPVFYPNNNRYVFFVSLRSDPAQLPTFDGYDPKNPDTHYTRLFMWDTTKSPTDAGYVVLVRAVKGKSILYPRFSSDGTYITWTEADIHFEMDSKTGYIADPVFDIDVSRATLQTEFASRVFLGGVKVTDPPADNKAASATISNDAQISSFVDTNKQAPRDMMSFFTPINQVGFSTDRLDNDGDRLADAVEPDPTKALFDIYVFPFPYDPAFSDESSPDSSPHRQTLGDMMINTIPGDTTSPLIHFDDSNELNADVAPIDYTAAVLNLLTPRLLYQADDRIPSIPPPATVDPNDLGWDIWTTNRASSGGPTGGTSLQGDILNGLPVVTPNQTLDAKQLSNLVLEHRKGLPSDYVNITVKLNPKYYEFDSATKAPITQIFALVKDPDNRIYKQSISEVVSGITIPVWEEIDAYPVKFDGTDFSDYIKAWAGIADAPQVGALIQLKAVDAAPDPAFPITYTGKWYTPREASDFMIDIEVTEPAIAATSTSPAVPAQNFITDNIGGFSTAPFFPTSRVLIVSDFAAGQKSMDATTGGSAAVYGTNGVRCESYFLDHPAPSSIADGTPIWDQIRGYSVFGVFGPRLEWNKPPTVTEDAVSHRLVVGNDGELNFNSPLFVDSLGGNEYDLWRTQCREPITLDDVKDISGRVISRGLMHNYLPYTHTQPGYPVPTVLRTERVADRCILWLSPHTGNLNGNAGQNSAEVGTIANLSTQTELVNYMNRGGRLLVAGGDVAFVLAQNNPSSVNALLARMKVAFQSDADRDEVTPFAFHRTDLAHVTDTNLGGLNPLPYAMIQPHWPGGQPTDVPLASPAGYRTNESRLDASLSNYHQDGITPVGVGTLGGAEPVWWWATAYEGDKTVVCAVQTHIPTSATDNTSTSKTAFFSFNPDAIFRGYNAPTGTPPYVISPNYPATILHNVVDYLCTGGIDGQVFITNNVASPKDVLVYAVDDYNEEGYGLVRGTALTDANGNFTMDGLEVSIYQLFAYKAGFSMQHLVRDPVDTAGNGYTTDNITLVPTQPGSIAGTVFKKGTTPKVVLPGVPVTLTDVTGVVNMRTVTDSNGQFAFINIPTGLYTITTPYGQWRTGEYYAAYTNIPGSLTISTGVNQTFDIPLVASSPITISGIVTDATTSDPVQGVTVTVADAGSVNTASAVTDINGYYAIGDLPDGTYTVTTPEGQYTMVVSTTDTTKNKPQYYDAFTNAASPIPVTRFANVNFSFQLTEGIPKPATIIVTVMDAFNTPSTPANGAVVSVFDAGTGVLAATLDSGDNPATTTVTGVDTDGTGTFHVNSGTYTITVTYNGLKAQTKTIVALPDDAADPTFANKVTFSFGILHTFTAGSVLMASLPYDYSGTTTAPITFNKVLSLTTAQLTNALVGFNALTQAFLFYPNYPADTARLGRGYGFKLPADGKVIDQGTTMSGSTAIVRTEIGWNLIGDPWPGTVVWNGTGTDAVRVTRRDDATQKQMTIDDAKAQGYILSDLWGGSTVDANGNSVYAGTYQVASPTMSLIPWQAYWVKVAQPMLFYVPKPAVATGLKAKAIAELEAMKGALMPTADTWGLNITASSEGLTDTGLALGLSRRATAGIDPGLDLAKPLPMGGADYLYTAFPMGKAGIFATDVRGLTTSNTWTFTVNTTLNARPVRVSWTPMGTLPAGYSAWLVDTATGQRTNMSAVDQYAFRSARDGGVRTFRVEVRRAGVTR